MLYSYSWANLSAVATHHNAFLFWMSSSMACLKAFGWNLIAIFVFWGSTEGMELGLVDHLLKLLLPLGDTLEMSPTFQLKKIVVTGVNGTSDRVLIGSNN